MPFTKRESEILEYLALGWTSNRIAETLNISKHTVDKHRRNMLKKAKAGNTVEMLNIFNAQNNAKEY